MHILSASFLLITLTGLATGSFASASAGTSTVNLEERTLNGVEISPSVDSIMDIIGRPTSLTKTARRQQLIYAEKGLQFEIVDRESVRLTIHLVRKRDILERYTFQPFSGQISHGISADTKAKEIMRLYGISPDTKAETDLRKSMNGSIAEMGTGMSKPTVTEVIGIGGVINVSVRKPSPLLGQPATFHGLIFIYDKETTFLKEIEIVWMP